MNFLPPHLRLLPVPDTTRVRFSISNARSQHEKGEHGDSLVNYIAVLKTQHAHRSEYFFEFMTVLATYLKHESNDSHTADIIQMSTSLYEDEFRIWFLVGEHYFKKGLLMRSMKMFRKALGCAKSNFQWVQASTSVENVKSHMFDAWHWRMVNDGKRNAKFADAIESALKKKPNARVLDIGCGSGIFTVLAARHSRTLALDHNEVMCHIARKCIAKNRVIVDVVQTHSKDFQLRNNIRCDLLITETLDSGIFGERIVSTILDAKERLLEPDALIIPSNAIALFSLVEADQISQENFYEYSDSIALISNCCNFVDTEKRYIPPSPYTCAYLNELPGGYRLLSAPTEGLAVDFTNTQQLKQIKNDQFFTEIVLTAHGSGIVSAVSVWFRLNLLAEQGFELCTAPEEGLCWQQAIFPFYPPRQVSPGDSLRFEVFIKHSALHVQPVWLPSIEQQQREVLRVPPSMDLTSMNDLTIRAFFNTAAADNLSTPNVPWKTYTQIVDCTDLLLNENFSIASRHSAIRYIGRDAVNLNKAECAPGGAILFWPFSNQGILMNDYLVSVMEFRLRSPAIAVIPYQIFMKGCLIKSEELQKRSQLIRDADEYKQTYCNVDMSAMADYAVTHFHEVETRTLEFQQISEDVEMYRMVFDIEGCSNYMNQMTSLKMESIFTSTTQAACNALLYWFEIVDPLGRFLDLRRQTQAFLPSAFILKNEKELNVGSTMKVNYSIMHGEIVFHSIKDVLFL